MSGKYENNIFDVILENINIIDVISSYITVERSGKNHKALCPFHSEKTASFIISEDKQLYHCFGCGAAGNAINFVMNYENLDYIDAVELLADRYHVDISKFQKGNDQKSSSYYTQFYDILRDAAIYYYKNLRTSDAAMQYLQNRNITFEDIKQFGLGFSNDAWQDIIGQLSKKYDLKSLEKVGLVIPGKDGKRYYDRFRNRIMFPIINPKGKVIGFGGRVMDDSLPKYLNSPETEIFNKSKTLYGLNLAKNALQEKKQLIIAEGYMDVIALHLNGFTNAVATLGTALTKEHGRLMRRYADEVIICYDSDIAGQKASLRSLEVLHGVIEKVRVVVLGENLDPDDYLKKYGIERFQAKLDQAMTATEYKLNHLKQGFNLNNEQEKIEFLSKAVVIIGELSNEFEKNLHIERLSDELNVNYDLVAKEVYKENYNDRSHYGFSGDQKKKEAVKLTTDRNKHLENQLIAFYIHKFTLLNEEQKKLIQQFQFSEATQDIIDYIMYYFSIHDTFSKQEIIENADITISTALIEILDSYIDEVEEIDIDLVLNNILIKNIDEELSIIQLKLKTQFSQEVRDEWRRLIDLKNTILQKVEKKSNFKSKE
ncbi:DNA primase [Fusibacter ferrireducens]|uniref:DNA primase n=1 Tax=Fusibacter ferrireducens TaxID=2785058 RepID=A0ABR9ZQY8_9FIRM|nr:DNA primase [Fusibacter ferrireducens]MBF4692059.1 DNA primase [Fusibacter ferrireducens]